MAVKHIPDGYHSITPYLVVKGAAETLDFLKKAFDATEVGPPMRLPDGTVSHAELKIGDSIFMLGEADPVKHPAMPTMLYLYVPDVDAAYKKAIAAGGKVVKEPMTQFYGDRSGGLLDPGGNQWWVATHVEDVSPEEMEKRAAQFYAEKAKA